MGVSGSVLLKIFHLYIIAVFHYAEPADFLTRILHEFFNNSVFAKFPDTQKQMAVEFLKNSDRNSRQVGKAAGCAYCKKW